MDGGSELKKQTAQEIDAIMDSVGRAARIAARDLAQTPRAAKDKALLAAAKAMRAHAGEIKTANAKDMAVGSEKNLTPALMDRLELNDSRIEAMAKGLEDIAALNDPVGEVIMSTTRPNGLKIERVRTPLGVIGIIYESRPNVTADAGALCLKAGNACILRGGSESFHSTTDYGRLDCLRRAFRWCPPPTVPPWAKC